MQKVLMTTALALGPLLGIVRAAELPKPGTTQILGISIHTADPTEEEMSLIADGGWSMARVDVNWNQVETTPGVYNFDYGGQWPVNVMYDRWSVERGRQSMFILTDVGANPLYGAQWSQTWQDGFVNFAAATAAKYKGSNNIYEILNEPFLDPITPAAPPSLYVNLAARVSQAMRAVDPNVKIIGPAVSPAPGFAPDYLKSWFQQGLLNSVDAISLHPYTYNQAPEQIVQMYTDVRSWMQTYGGKVIPIIASEDGWYTTPATNGVSFQTQADYLARYNLINLSQNIYGSVDYSFRNGAGDPSDPESNYGLTNTPDTPPTLADAKPSYFAMKLLAELLAGKEFSSRLDDGNSNDWLLLFTAPNGDQTLAAWTTLVGTRSVDLPGWGSFSLTGSPRYLFRTVSVPEPCGIMAMVLCGGAMGLCGRRRTSNV